MTYKELPSPELLRKLLRYDPETGKLFWRERGPEFFKLKRDQTAWNSRFANQEAFTSLSRGYKLGGIFSGRYSAHRVIWAMQTGYCPTQQIDHIDRDKANNRWENLREASGSQNQANRLSKENSSSKYLGVSWCNTYKKWRAHVRDKKRGVFLGRFDDEIVAAKKYDAHAIRIHGEFANLNFPMEKPNV